MPALKQVPGLLVASTQQTITKSWLTAARESGGDAIDLDPANGNFIGQKITFFFPKTVTRMLTMHQPTSLTPNGRTPPMMS